jgi:hypothetical protein
LRVNRLFFLGSIARNNIAGLINNITLWFKAFINSAPIFFNIVPNVTNNGWLYWCSVNFAVKVFG